MNVIHVRIVVLCAGVRRTAGVVPAAQDVYKRLEKKIESLSKLGTHLQSEHQGMSQQLHNCGTCMAFFMHYITCSLFCERKSLVAVYSHVDIFCNKFCVYMHVPIPIHVHEYTNKCAVSVVKLFR